MINNEFLDGNSVFRCFYRVVNFTGFSSYESEADSLLPKEQTAQSAYVDVLSSLKSLVSQVRTSLLLSLAQETGWDGVYIFLVIIAEM